MKTKILFGLLFLCSTFLFAQEPDCSHSIIEVGGDLWAIPYSPDCGGGFNLSEVLETIASIFR